MPSFNVADVKSRADQIVLTDKGNIEAARLVFLEEIMDWTDYYTEMCSGEEKEHKRIFDSIVNLWIQFSVFEIQLHQFKKAVEVFEKAINDPIGSKSLKIFQVYADFCVDRNKLANAQKVFMKGLCAGLSDSDNAALWSSFLKLMHTINKSDLLTLEQLYEAAKNQLAGAGTLAPPSIVSSPLLINNTLIGSSDSVSQTLSVNKLVNSDSHFISTQDNYSSTDILSNSEATDICTNSEITTNETLTIPNDCTMYVVNYPHVINSATEASEVKIKMEVSEDNTKALASARDASAMDSSTFDTVKTERITNEDDMDTNIDFSSVAADGGDGTAGGLIRYAAPDDLDDVSGMTPEQIIKVYNCRPPMLFTALHKEPTASGMNAITAADRLELDTFFHKYEAAKLVKCSSSSTTNTSTMTDSTAVKITDASAGTRNEVLSSTTTAAADPLLLDLLECMWAAQALKERHFDSWITDLRTMHIDKETELTDGFAAIESRMINKSIEENNAEKHRQQSELLRFQNHCAVQQELLHALINKALFSLLIEQQVLLTHIGFPRFSTTFINSLQAFVMNRKSSGGGAITKQHHPKQNEFDPVIVETLTAQRALVCALLSTRLHAVRVERSRLQHLHHQQEQQQQMQARSRYNQSHQQQQQQLHGKSDADFYNNGNNDSTTTNIEVDLDYYNAEAKKRRKRRRIILQNHNDSYSQSTVSSYADNKIAAQIASLKAQFTAPGAPTYAGQQQLQQQQQQGYYQQSNEVRVAAATTTSNASIGRSRFASNNSNSGPFSQRFQYPRLPIQQQQPLPYRNSSGRGGGGIIALPYTGSSSSISTVSGRGGGGRGNNSGRYDSSRAGRGRNTVLPASSVPYQKQQQQQLWNDSRYAGAAVSVDPALYNNMTTSSTGQGGSTPLLQKLAHMIQSVKK